MMMFNSVISTWDSSIKNLIFIKYLVILKYGLIEEVMKFLFQSLQSQGARAPTPSSSVVKHSLLVFSGHALIMRSLAVSLQT